MPAHPAASRAGRGFPSTSTASWCESGRDAKIVGGSAAAGAILGAIADGSKGAVRGVLVGAGAGGAAVLIGKGREIEMPSGSRWTVRVRNAVRL